MDWVDWAIWGSIIVLIVLLVERFYHLFSYLFFLRYPLIFLLVLLTPFCVPKDPSATIENLFIQKQYELMWTSWLAIFTGWTVMYGFLYLWLRIPIRTKLAFSRKENQTKSEEERKNNLVWPFHLRWVRLVLSSMLALPLIWVCIERSSTEYPEGGSYLWASLGVICAIVSFFIFMGLRWVIFRIKYKKFWSFLNLVAHLPILLDRIIVGKQEIQRGLTGFEISVNDENRSGFHASNAIVFGLGILAVYAGGYFLLDPTDTDSQNLLRENFPVLAYVLLLLMLLNSVLTWASFQFDKYRIPPEVVVLVVATISWGMSKADHFYSIQKLQCPPPEFQRRWGPIEAISSWGPMHAHPPPLIVIAASGGGIKAASWTATVLTGLANQVPRFSSSVRLISSVSGGSLGAMYFVNGYNQNGQTIDLPNIRDSAARSSLAAMGWGLIYPDFLRFFLPWFPSPEEDRGWALESEWFRGFNDNQGKTRPTLESWYPDIKEGTRPAVVFNATIVETGQQFVISNLDFKFPEESEINGIPRVQSFRRLYPGADLNIETAARLSATFPWVTPVARPLTNCPSVQPYHIADGGYYDNFGMVSIIQYLREALPTYRARGGKEVLLVRIRASDTTQVKEPADTNSGFQLETFGPAITMLAVRSASQIARNDLDFRLIRDKWRDKGVNIKDVIFELRIPAPISWHLACSERKRIEGYFQSTEVQEKVATVASVFGDQPLPKENGRFHLVCPNDAPSS